MALDTAVGGGGPAVGGGAGPAAQQGGFWCSTASTVLTSKEELRDHYASELHRYNLKRKASWAWS